MNAGAQPYDVVIFDLDGTLTESELGIVNCVQYALEKMNVPVPDRSVLRAFVGPPLHDSFIRLAGLSEADTERAVEYYRERYGVIGYLENWVYPGVPALLRTLKARGVYVALATAKPHPVCDEVIKAFDLYKYFDRVIAPNQDNRAASKRELVRAALPEHYTRACMVGDRCFDMEGARQNGVDAIGVSYGYGDIPELTQAGATHIVHDMKALTQLLLGDEEMAPGVFISMEGSDGCGKSTQHALLAQWLKTCGHELIVTREPGGCPISERIRSIVLDAREMGMSDACEALLFAAARAQHVYEVIRPAILRGAWVLCDRFVDSSIAYQGIGRGMGEALVRAINAPAIDGCMPDLTILLDIDPDCAMGRRVAADAPDRIEKAAGDFVRRVYEGYQALAQAEPNRFAIVDADGTPEAVFARVKHRVSENTRV